MKRVLLALLLTTPLFAGAPDNGKKEKGRPSHLMVESGTLTTGSGANVQLSKVEIVVPPKEQQPKPNEIVSGSAFLTSENLTTLIRDKLGKTDLSDFKIQTENGGKAKISANKKEAGIPVPISVEGPVSVTDQGTLRMAIDAEHVVGIPIKDLADAFGMHPKDMVNTKKKSGFSVQNDAILIDPSQMMGSSANSHVQSVEVTDKGMRLIFGQAKKKR